MEEETRLGNRDKGWNDPPTLAYSRASKAGPSRQRNLLNQRVAMPIKYPSLSAHAGTAQPTPAVTSPQGPPQPTLAVTSPPGPPPVQGNTLVRIGGPGGVMRDTKLTQKHLDGDTGEAEMEEDVSGHATLAKLRDVFAQCQDKLQKKVITDVERRLNILHDSWKANKLSRAVQQQTSKLASDLEARRYDSAYEIHLSLMLNHVSEVSQWMVGVKRLTHEARMILPAAEKEIGGNETPPGCHDVTDDGDGNIPTLSAVGENPCTDESKANIKMTDNSQG